MRRVKNDSPHNNLVATIVVIALVVGIAATLWVVSTMPEQGETAPVEAPAQP